MTEIKEVVASRYHHTFSRSHSILSHIKPGMTIITKTVDSSGHDYQGNRLSGTGNPLTGPFFIEGAEPGDTEHRPRGGPRCQCLCDCRSRPKNGNLTTCTSHCGNDVCDACISQTGSDQQRAWFAIVYRRAVALPILGCGPVHWRW